MVGYSVRGRPIWAFHTGPTPEAAPQVMLQAQIHASEWIGSAMLLELLDHLSMVGPPDKTGLWIIPSANPDGFERILRRWQHGNIAAGRKNANGVDLNRNWPVGFGEGKGGFFDGSTNRLSPYFRGETPISEPESQTLAKLVREKNIRACLSLHSFGEYLGFPPCRENTPTVDHALFLQWADAMTQAQPRPYRYGPEVEFYPAFGDFNDWLYEEMGILAFLLEIGRMGLDPYHPKSWFQPLYWFNPMAVARECGVILPLLMKFVALSQDHKNFEVRHPRFAAKTTMEAP